MDNHHLSVDNLRKISISIEAGTSPDVMDLTKSPGKLDFIFGIGNNGITPFEYELVNKHQGDNITVRIQRDSAPVFFEHLAFPILNQIRCRDAFYLKARILSVTQPDHREIIKALAEKSSCGDSCDCGCGCGI